MLYAIAALLAAILVTLVVIARRVRSTAPATGRFDEAQLRVLQQLRADARRCLVLHRAAYWRERGRGEPEGLADALRGES